MSRRRSQTPAEGRRKGRWLLALAVASVGASALAHTLIRRRARPPQGARWGRSHRYAARVATLAFQELGDGPPVVLIHALGPGFDGTQWQGVAEELARHNRVLVVDLPGFGQSGELDAADPDIFIDAIADFLNAVVWEPAVIVAAGLPAAYAAAVAAEIPERVRALALVTPLGLGADLGPGSPSGHNWVSWMLAVPGLRATVLDTVTSRVALDRFLRSEVYAAPERVDAAVLEHHYRASHQSICQASLTAWLRGRLAYDPTQALARLTQPVWLCWGRDARHPPVEDADLWLHHVPGAELEILPGTGALPHAEQPTRFAQALGRFIAALPELPASQQQ